VMRACPGWSDPIVPSAVMVTSFCAGRPAIPGAHHATAGHHNTCSVREMIVS